MSFSFCRPPKRCIISNLQMTSHTSARTMKNLILPFCRWRSLSVTLSVFFTFFHDNLSIFSSILPYHHGHRDCHHLLLVFCPRDVVPRFFIWLFERRKEAEKEAEDTRGRLSNRLQASPSVQKKTNNKKKKRWRVRINSIWSYSVYISIRVRERLRENADREGWKACWALPSSDLLCNLYSLTSTVEREKKIKW